MRKKAPSSIYFDSLITYHFQTCYDVKAIINRDGELGDGKETG